MTTTTTTNAIELPVDATAEVQGFLNPQPIPPGRQAQISTVRPYALNSFGSDRGIIVVGGRAQMLPPQQLAR